MTIAAGSEQLEITNASMPKRCHVPLEELLAEGLIAARGEICCGAANESRLETLQ
jgi:hypothetical protein